MPIYAPFDGTVLQELQESETTMPAGAPVMEVVNVESDLEVEADLISSDAATVTVGERVLIDQ